VNESAGEQVTDFLNDDLQLPKTDDDDIDDEVPARTMREGLPRSFRMRHDAHYVDELMSRTAETPADVADAVASPAQPVPAPALPLIASRLESLVAHAGVIRSQHAAALMAQSVYTEFARVARLARAGAILQDDEPLVRRTVSAREIADAALLAGGPVARLGGLECDVVVEDPSFTILADSALMLQSIAGTIDALVDLLFADPGRPSFIEDPQSAARISIKLQSVRVRPAIIVEVICPALLLGSRQAERFFDNDPDDFRIVPAAGILLAAAARIVRAHGGRADVQRDGRRGTTVSLVFPQAVGEIRLG
jgi:hypothetical protein